MYDSVEQAHLRLSATVLAFDGHMRYCEKAMAGRDTRGAIEGIEDADIVLRLYKFDGRAGYDYVKLDDPRLQFNKLRSGYFNTPTMGAALLTRRPTRCYKQAFCRDNSGVRPINSPRLGPDTGRSTLDHYVMAGGLVGADRIQATSAMVHAGLFRGEYPDLRTATEMLREAAGRMRDDRSNPSVAISRMICLVYDRDLETTFVQCRGDLIGMYMKSSGLVLPRPKAFYKEEAELVFPKVSIQTEAA